jgi:hypothetical protein
MKRFKEFIKENVDTEDLVERIKKHFVDEEERESWEDFVDSQEMGDCQSIVASIIRNFPQVEKVFGEIEVDEPYIDEDGEEQILMTHHWVEIDGEIYDFSKGTLRGYVEFDDIYDPEVTDDSIYNGF